MKLLWLGLVVGLPACSSSSTLTTEDVDGTATEGMPCDDDGLTPASYCVKGLACSDTADGSTYTSRYCLDPKKSYVTCTKPGYSSSLDCSCDYHPPSGYSSDTAVASCAVTSQPIAAYGTCCRESATACACRYYSWSCSYYSQTLCSCSASTLPSSSSGSFECNKAAVKASSKHCCLERGTSSRYAACDCSSTACTSDQVEVSSCVTPPDDATACDSGESVDDCAP